MERINYSPYMTQHLIEEGVLLNDPFTLIDVGASGGIASHWDLFKEDFQAFAFEPLIAECERLNSGKQKKITYFPYFVISDDEEVRAESGNHFASTIFQRTSAAFVYELKKYNYAKEHFNAGKELVYSDEKISLSKFITLNPLETVDFIKIDTDGYDYEVLDGARKILAEKEVLGIEIESQFHGKSHMHSNTFRNIDRVLTEEGFSLFDLDVWRYTKSALPGRFKYDIPAVTTTGQALYGDALYLRDYAAKDTKNLTPTKIIKLACLHELYCKPDCAAELLNMYREQLPIDVDRCLDLLVKNMDAKTTYDEYLKYFKEKTEDFYPLKYKTFSSFLPRGSARRSLIVNWIRKLASKLLKD